MIIRKKDWEILEKMNQEMIQKWEALTHAYRKGKTKEIIAAEMQYLCALQNVNATVEIAVSPTGRN